MYIISTVNLVHRKDTPTAASHTQNAYSLLYRLTLLTRPWKEVHSSVPMEWHDMALGLTPPQGPDSLVYGHIGALRFQRWGGQFCGIINMHFSAIKWPKGCCRGLKSMQKMFEGWNLTFKFAHMYVEGVGEPRYFCKRGHFRGLGKCVRGVQSNFLYLTYVPTYLRVRPLG